MTIDRIFADNAGTDDSTRSGTSVIWATALADSSNGYVLVQIGTPIDDDASIEVGEDFTVEAMIDADDQEDTEDAIGEDAAADEAGADDAGIEDEDGYDDSSDEDEDTAD